MTKDTLGLLGNVITIDDVRIKNNLDRVVWDTVEKLSEPGQLPWFSCLTF